MPTVELWKNCPVAAPECMKKFQVFGAASESPEGSLTPRVTVVVTTSPDLNGVAGVIVNVLVELL